MKYKKTSYIYFKHGLTLFNVMCITLPVNLTEKILQNKQKSKETLKKHS